MKTLTLGYSPYGMINSTVFPFDDIFDDCRNLMLCQDLIGIDGVVLWGGSDISPTLYNQPRYHFSGPAKPSDRDIFEWEILRQAYAKKIPIIGVCRGAQLICAFAGGKLVQDCSGHGTGHSITTNDGKTFEVSSSHHQMMYPYHVPGHELLAWSTIHKCSYYHGLTLKESDELVQRNQKEAEVVYFPDINAMAIQCHPEWHKEGDPFNEWILQQIIEKQFSNVVVG